VLICHISWFRVNKLIILTYSIIKPKIMKSLQLFCVLLISGLATIGFSQSDPVSKGLDAITLEAVQGQLEFLASDWTEGREASTPGIYMAADYIASMFKVYGLEPGGDEKMIFPSWEERRAGKRPYQLGTYFQNFKLIQVEQGEDHELSVNSGPRTIHFKPGVDFSVYSSDLSVEVNAPVVFVGYGYVNEKEGYDDFKGIDVRNKIILRLQGYPGHDDPESKGYTKFQEPDRPRRYRRRSPKDEAAKEKGALAIIEVDLNRDVTSGLGSNLPFRYNTRMYEGDDPPPSSNMLRLRLPEDTLDLSPVRVSISNRVLNEIIAGTGINLETYANTVKNTLKPAPQNINKLIHLKTDVITNAVQVRNVIGIIPGKDTTHNIVLGGHYDHLGKYGGFIWNGADDNASGTVGVMTIAKAMIATGEKPEKNIIFCAWTAEEKGLIGSRYFVSNFPDASESIDLYLNYDMISRDSRDDSLGNKISMMYTSGYKALEDDTQAYNEKYDMDLEISFRSNPRPGGGSDHSSFAREDIPIFYFMAGFPEEYHQPDDHVELVNWDKMVKIIKLGYLNIYKWANEDLVKEVDSRQ
jgi:hypothetical protein